MIRQEGLIRMGEKIGIKIFSGLNYFGLLKSQKPLPVSNLAEKMVEQIKMKNGEKVVTIKSFK